MVRRVQEDQEAICDERNAQNKNNRKEKYPLSHELTGVALST